MAAHAKMFMGEPIVSQFLARLWHRASNNGKLVDASVKSSPRAKCYVAIAGHAAFLGLHAVYITSFPEKGVEFSSRACTHAQGDCGHDVRAARSRPASYPTPLARFV